MLHKTLISPKSTEGKEEGEEQKLHTPIIRKDKRGGYKRRSKRQLAGLQQIMAVINKMMIN